MGYQGVALFLAAVIGIGFAAYQYYTQRNTAYTQDTQNRSQSYTYVPSPEVPTNNSRKRRRASATENCIICYEALKTSVQKLSCNHSFHKDCIEGWFKMSRTCPVCRRAV